MKNKEKYWVENCVVLKSAKEPFPNEAGPFETAEQAEKWIRLNRWRRTTHSPMQWTLFEIFMEACGRWKNYRDVQSYLKEIGGKILLGRNAAYALVDEDPPDQVVFHVSCRTPCGNKSPFSTNGKPPIAIVLPKDVALKIAALGGIP